MNLFETVKRRLTTRQVAEHYGFTISRNGMLACPFHNDRTPSMKVDKRFHCFGCGADGDVIDFVGRLYGLDARHAALKLVEEFQIPYEHDNKDRKTTPPVRQKTQAQAYRELEQRCYRVLSDYQDLLRRWEMIYRPNPEATEWDPRFVEAVQQKDYIEHLLETLLQDPIEIRAELLRDHGKEVLALERRLSELGSAAERDAADAVGDPALSDDRGCDAAAGTDR